MFKYLWIVIIALIVLYCIWYTVICIIEAYQCTKDWSSVLSYLSDEHDILCTIWFTVLCIGIMLLFTVSLSVYLDALE